MGFVFAILAGAAMSVQGVMNTRLGEGIGTMEANCLVQSTAASAPSLVLAEGRRGGAPGLKIEPPLIVRTDSGVESAEYRRICHRGDT